MVNLRMESDASVEEEKQQLGWRLSVADLLAGVLIGLGIVVCMCLTMVIVSWSLRYMFG
jgi:hypothetical protein